MTTFGDDMLSGFPVVVVQDVAWGDMDAYRHVNNVVYFRYFENARLELLRQLDWGAVTIPTDVGPLLTATEARFLRPLCYPDTIASGVRVLDVQEDQFIVEHKIVSQRLHEVTTTGEGVVISYHFGAGRKAPLPTAVRERLLLLMNGSE